MTEPGRYTAEQLAFKAWLPVRTVRFYVQEKLIDPPLGRGRGANFTDDHLVQLQQARVLQNAGFSLQAIREQRADLSTGLKAIAKFEAMRLAWARRQDETADDEDDEDGDAPSLTLDPGSDLRIPMADGVELLVSQDRRLPSPKALVDLAFHIRKIFGPP